MLISEIAESKTRILVPTGNALALITKLAANLELKINLWTQGDYDRDEAASDAVRIMKIWVDDRTKGSNVLHTLMNIRRNLAINDVFEQLKNSGEALSDFSFTPQPWFQAGLDGNATLVSKADAMRDHITATNEYYDFLLICYNAVLDPSDERHEHAWMIKAVFRKLGIL